MPDLSGAQEPSRRTPGRRGDRPPISRLESFPEIGRPNHERPELRELLIQFGDSGYIALYRFEASDDAVYILAFRHQKEAGW